MTTETLPVELTGTDTPVRCRSAGCSHPASWVMVLRCCTTRPTYLCDRHRLKLYTALTGLAPRLVMCIFCRNTPVVTYEERLT